jgi:hypothetical protein
MRGRQTNQEALTASLHYSFASFRELAADRNHKFLLTFNEYCDIVNRKCAFCRMSPNIRLTSRDARSTLCLVDLYKDFSAANVLPACRTCYGLRSTITDKRFEKLTRIWLILQRHKEENEKDQETAKLK